MSKYIDGIGEYIADCIGNGSSDSIGSCSENGIGYDRIDGPFTEAELLNYQELSSDDREEIIASAGFIASEDDQGFFDYEGFDTLAELETAWRRCVEHIEEIEGQNPREEDYTISDGRTLAYSVGIVGGKCLGEFATRAECEDAIRNHAGKDWRPSVWVISDHGNAHLVTDFDWKD